MRWTIYGIAIALTLGGCAKNEPPEYDNVNNIVIGGEPITARQYHNKYCKNAKPEVLNHVRCTTASNTASSQQRLESLRLNDKDRELQKLDQDMGISPTNKQSR